MRDILTVMKFTINDMAKRKSFIISTLIILVMIVIGFNIPNIIDAMSDGGFTSKSLIVDNENIEFCKKILNKYGLKTLAKGEKEYVEVYEGDGYQRDTSYHQGITWPWLLGLYYNSLKNIITATKDKELKKNYQNRLKEFILITGIWFPILNFVTLIFKDL